VRGATTLHERAACAGLAFGQNRHDRVVGEDSALIASTRGIRVAAAAPTQSASVRDIEPDAFVRAGGVLAIERQMQAVFAEQDVREQQRSGAPARNRRLGHVLADLAQGSAAAARVRRRHRIDDTLVQQLLGQGTPRRLAPLKAPHLGLRGRRCDLRRRLSLGCILLQVRQLQLELLKDCAAL
jgi:hypothetical protein